ncbi:hypothetical protein [Halothermothrix orenii]|nr:hypothetical protein [Halothermothrix orenii]
MILFLHKIGFWDISLLKNTIIWIVAVAFISSFRAVDNAKDINYFINVIKDNIKLIIILTFVVNLYSFSLIYELIQVFIITVLSMLVAFMNNNPEYQDKDSKLLINVLNTILAIIGFYALFHSIKMTISNLDSINLIKQLKLLFLPSVLSVMFTIYVYFLVIYSGYEQIFSRINFKKTIDDEYKLYLKFKTMLFCNINLNKIKNFIPRSKIMYNHINSKSDVKEILNDYKDNNFSV